MTQMGELLSVVMFGSVARGDGDDLSDLDVLAIVKNKSGKVDSSEVVRYLPDWCVKEPTISWYGLDRLKQMYLAGELFSWHIYREGKVLHNKGGALQGLGRPHEYTNALSDIENFQKTLRSIPHQIAASESNAIYELGVLYVCARNIAMSASWHLCAEPDFSRYSPYQIGVGELAMPIPKATYDRSMLCRMSSQRGIVPPKGVNAAVVLETYDQVEPWTERVLQRLREVLRK